MQSTYGGRRMRGRVGQNQANNLFLSQLSIFFSPFQVLITPETDHRGQSKMGTVLFES